MEEEAEDWVERGFEEFRQLVAEGQRAFVADKAAVPGAPVSAGGVPAAGPITDFKAASDMLRERLRNQ